MIKPWIFEFLYAPGALGEEVAPQTATAVFDAGVALWQRIDKLGFEGIFFSEHHFGLSYSPSPNLLIAAIARSTERLRLGTMGMVLPLYQPWRVLEEIGMLDHLTGGRLEIGCASGVPQELIQIGIAAEENRERFNEALEILDAWLAEPVISHHGQLLELRQPAHRAATPAAALAAQVDDGGEHCLGHQVRRAPVQDLHGLRVRRAHQGDLRCLPRRGRPARHRLRARAARHPSQHLDRAERGRGAREIADGDGDDPQGAGRRPPRARRSASSLLDATPRPAPASRCTRTSSSPARRPRWPSRSSRNAAPAAPAISSRSWAAPSMSTASGRSSCSASR